MGRYQSRQSSLKKSFEYHLELRRRTIDIALSVGTLNGRAQAISI